MGLFGGGNSSSKTSTKKTTITQTDTSVQDLKAEAGGVSLVKRDRGRQVVNINGLRGGDLSALIGSLSGANAAALDQASASNQAVADLARSATGSQSEAGKLIGALGLPVMIVLGLFLFFRKRRR